MPTAIRSEASRSVVVVNGVDTMAINQDGSVELLNAASASGANDVPTFGTALVQATAQSATGTAVDFTGIPSWAKRVSVMFNGVSTNGSSLALVQVGAESFVTSGYLGCTTDTEGAGSGSTNHSSGILLNNAGNAAFVRHGSVVLANAGDNLWVISGTIGHSNVNRNVQIGGSVPLSGPLDRIRLTTVNGTDQFDAGTVNIMWE